MVNSSSFLRPQKSLNLQILAYRNHKKEASLKASCLRVDSAVSYDMGPRGMVDETSKGN